ncbi:hypothetical protein CEXT_629381 [Caerostris extrusa]|uniref:Uncharacterized protein n=1 Tax=Caerostris extrusa TaxID=172846 RepID=A0AAV4U748_CAEEX|nr:hypothetical protein CEXT_629381 [Caerostris extrusa]
MSAHDENSYTSYTSASENIGSEDTPEELRGDELTSSSTTATTSSSASSPRRSPRLAEKRSRILEKEGVTFRQKRRRHGTGPPHMIIVPVASLPHPRAAGPPVPGGLFTHSPPHVPTVRILVWPSPPPTSWSPASGASSPPKPSSEPVWQPRYFDGCPESFATSLQGLKFLEPGQTFQHRCPGGRQPGEVPHHHHPLHFSLNILQTRQIWRDLFGRNSPSLPSSGGSSPASPPSHHRLPDEPPDPADFIHISSLPLLQSHHQLQQAPPPPPPPQHQPPQHHLHQPPQHQPPPPPPPPTAAPPPPPLGQSPDPKQDLFERLLPPRDVWKRPVMRPELRSGSRKPGNFPMQRPETSADGKRQPMSASSARIPGTD